MMQGLKSITLGALAFITFAAALGPFAGAEAQQLCLVRDDAIRQLGERHGERIAARGIAEDGRAMLELLKSETGSWTLVATDVHGRSCVLASGEGWSEITRQPGAPS